VVAAGVDSNPTVSRAQVGGGGRGTNAVDGVQHEPTPRHACSIYAAWVYNEVVEQVLPEDCPYRGGPSREQVAAAAPENFYISNGKGQYAEAETASARHARAGWVTLVTPPLCLPAGR